LQFFILRKIRNEPTDFIQREEFADERSRVIPPYHVSAWIEKVQGLCQPLTALADEPSPKRLFDFAI
jgi:hypothetical protein